MSKVYTVIKPFTYAGQDLERGEEWTPAGHRNDRAIIRSRMVIEVEEEETEEVVVSDGADEVGATLTGAHELGVALAGTRRGKGRHARGPSSG